MISSLLKKPFCLLALLSMLNFGCDENTHRKPNVIFILADDLGYSELGVYGNRFNETPHLDTLAANGLMFTQAYAAAPVCSPYRAALMTGQHPARLGITDYLRPHGDEHLDEGLITIAELFKSSGYHTGIIGKWHLSGYEKNNAIESPPTKHGFEEVILNEKRGISGGSYFYPYHFHQNAEQRIFPEEHLTDRVNLEAIDFIDRNKDKPFFLFKSHYSVHTNLNGKGSLVKKYARKPGAGLSPESPENNVHLAAQLEVIDLGVSMIVNKLRALDLLDNTIIIFTSDNGGETNVTSNAPLRAGKSTLYEGGIRIPLIVYWPEQIRKGEVVDLVTSNTDFFPTFAELLDLQVNEEQEMDGTSLLWALKDEKHQAERVKDRKLYWHYPLQAPHFLGGFSSGAVRVGDYKLIENYTTGQKELYDLKNDLKEQHDLSDQLPKIKDRLYQELHRWRGQMGVKVVGHTKRREQLPELPQPDSSAVRLTIDEKEVPFINYGVTVNAEGKMIFDGRQNFLKLLHVYIPDVTAKTVELGALINPQDKNGVIISHGEEVFGVSLYLKESIPYFSTRKYGKLVSIKGKNPIDSETKLRAKLSSTGSMKLWINDQLADETNIGESLPIPPDDPISIGYDVRRLVGSYDANNYYTGTISDIYFNVTE